MSTLTLMTDHFGNRTERNVKYNGVVMSLKDFESILPDLPDSMKQRYEKLMSARGLNKLNGLPAIKVA